MTRCPPILGGVNLILRTRGTDLNDRLREYAQDKLGRVDRIFGRIIKMEVELACEPNPRVKDGHRVEVTVKAPGETLRAHGGGADFYAAIDQAADRLERQLRRLKGRLTDNHRGRNNNNGPPLDTPETTVGEDLDGDEPAITRVESPVAKPMAPEEAILELEGRGMQFLLFTDSTTLGACVVYRRADGTYGLIEHRG